MSCAHKEFDSSPDGWGGCLQCGADPIDVILALTSRLQTIERETLERAANAVNNTAIREWMYTDPRVFAANRIRALRSDAGGGEK